jgi:integrase
MDRPTVLTDAAVKRAKAPLMRRSEMWCAALPGFGLRVTHKGHRSFVLLARLRGRPIRLTLGSYPDTSLAAARTRAKAALDAIARGEDPRDLKRPTVAAPAPRSVERVATDFVEKWSKPRKRTWEEDERILGKYVTPRWRGRRLDAITRTDVVDLVEAVATDHGPIMANRTLAVIKKLLAWALNRGLLEAHPAAGLTPPAPERTRDRVLTDAELKKLWKAWATMSYPFGTALQLLALTAARRGEVEAMAWSELDLDERLWTIPAARYETGLPLLVPLAAPVVELFASTPRLDGCPYVFRP